MSEARCADIIHRLNSPLDVNEWKKVMTERRNNGWERVTCKKCGYGGWVRVYKYPKKQKRYGKK